MHTCENCGNGYFEGRTEEGHGFCSDACWRQAKLVTGQFPFIAIGLLDSSEVRYMIEHTDIPVDLLEQTLRRVHQGPCPVCEGPGPVEAYPFLGQANHQVFVCCQRCANDARPALRQILVQCFRNPSGMIGYWRDALRSRSERPQPGPTHPSATLHQWVELQLAIHLNPSGSETPSSIPPEGKKSDLSASC